MIRFGWRALLIAIGLLICVPLHYLSLLLGGSRWPRRFLAWAAYASGMRVRVEGTPLRRHVLFLSNHISWLDILVLAGASGTAFVSKDDVGRWPVVGWLARLNNTVFIARTARTAAKNQADALRVALARGQPVALFPEGVTGDGVQVLPFKASLLASLFPQLPDVMVQPVALDYGPARHDLVWQDEETAPQNARRLLSRKGTVPVAVRFLTPIDPAATGDRKALATLARGEIVAALGGAPSGPAADGL